MKNGIRGRRRDFEPETIDMPDFMKREIEAQNRDNVWGSGDDPYDAEDEIYNADGQPIPPISTAPKYEPEKSTGQILSNVERKQWRDRINAMAPQERAVALSTFTVDEIFAELKRRIAKSNEYINTIKEVVDQYHEGEE